MKTSITPHCLVNLGIIVGLTPNQPTEQGRAQRTRDRPVESEYTPYYDYNSSNHSTDSGVSRSDKDNVTHVSNCDRLSNQHEARSFNSASNAFTRSFFRQLKT